ncbi:MAG: cysteine desulfurase [Coxiella sp. DG_40]|nr:MAG: cysteine desulfurase [Coxiella sp. DG_40]
MIKKVYLDHNATTPLHPEVKKAMQKALNMYGNPSSLYSLGRQARQLVEAARQQVATFIGAQADEIIFTGSGTEANNTVLSPVNNEIITTSIEHPAILEPAKFLQKKGIAVKYLDVDQYGKINIKQLKKLISKKTDLVSVIMVNNEIGTIQDIKAISNIVHRCGALMHTDAIQAVGKIPVNVKDLGVDLLTVSAHKMYGPKGIGALYIKNGIPFSHFILGGHQENNRRAGTENTLGIIGFGEAAMMRAKEMDKEHERLLALKNILKNGIEKTIPDVKFNGHPSDCVAGTLNVSFAGAEGESILLYLDLEGIAVSTGSACASGSLDPSHVLLATGASAEYAHGSIRISLGRENTRDDIKYVLNVLPKVIKKIRDMSTVYNR